MTVEQCHKEMDRAYAEFGPKLRAFLEVEIDRLVDETSLLGFTATPGEISHIVDDIFASLNPAAVKEFGRDFAEGSVMGVVQAAHKFGGFDVSE